MTKHKQEIKFRQRKLKVQPKQFARSYHRSVVFPEIKLCGKWLRDMGFVCGGIVSVKQEQNKLVITMEPE